MRHDNTSRERGREHRVRDKEYSSTRMNDRHDSPEGTHGYSSPDNYEHDIAHDSKDSSPAKRVLLGAFDILQCVGFSSSLGLKRASACWLMRLLSAQVHLPIFYYSRNRVLE